MTSVTTSSAVYRTLAAPEPVHALVWCMERKTAANDAQVSAVAAITGQ
jgi:hypothetical protein